ncbi:MAG TPA: hypothetical protein GXZ59_00595 [Clostridiaceae bacterium]|nr:hypothetical protein [Clostridiaceae bacterium]
MQKKKDPSAAKAPDKFRSARIYDPLRSSADIKVIELERRRRQAFHQEERRLAGISGRAALTITILSSLYILALEQYQPLADLLSTHSFRGYALEMLMVAGVLPVLASVLIVLLEKPAKSIVFGDRPSFTPSLLAFMSGFPLAFIGLTLDHLVSHFFTTNTFLQLPGWDLMNQGVMLFQSSWLQIALTIIVSSVLPALGLSFLLNGLILPGLAAGSYYTRAILMTAFFATLMPMQLRPLPVFFIFAVFICKVRLDSNSLITSSLASLGLGLGWLTYPLAYQFTADVFWGQLPSSTSQIISLQLPLLFLSAMIFLPILVYYTNYRNRRKVEEREKALLDVSKQGEVVGYRRKVDYVFVFSTILMSMILLVQSVI